MDNRVQYGGEKKQKKEATALHEILSRAGAVGLSGGLSGAILGGAGSLLSTANPRAIARAIGLGAISGAGIAGGASAVGSAVLPDASDDPSINTRRGGVGGAVVGGIGGAGLGGYAATRKGLEFANRGITSESALGRLAQSLASRRFGPAIGAGIGAVGGAGVGAFFGSDEGMQYDAIVNELRRRGAEL